MVKCPNCGENNRDGLKVCLKCGCELPLEPESPDMDNHKLRNAVIILLVLFVIGYLFINIVPSLLFTDNADSNSAQLADDSLSLDNLKGDFIGSDSKQNSSNFKENISNEDSSDSNEKSSSNLLSNSNTASKKGVDFGGYFTMDVEENLVFEEYGATEFGATKEWETDYDEYVEPHDERMFRVYFWDNVQASDLFQQMDEIYGQSFEDGNLIIYNHGFSSGDTNTFGDKSEYMAFVVSGNKIASVSGVDLDKVKQYANSIIIN